MEYLVLRTTKYPEPKTEDPKTQLVDPATRIHHRLP